MTSPTSTPTTSTTPTPTFAPTTSTTPTPTFAPTYAPTYALTENPTKNPTISAVSEPLTEADVLECQSKWASAIKNISKAYLEKGNYIATAGAAAAELYGIAMATRRSSSSRRKLLIFRST